MFLLRATPATPIGSVDAASAIKKAIDVFEITDPGRSGWSLNDNNQDAQNALATCGEAGHVNVT